ncbi:hypothetical protein BKA67DRAFT_537012 [Truncatella angustata]|uniref:Uncharacterized protein n=1 Tax=Truncatella angustata TaxID=152316 RepID=A0A9P8ZXS7_9PEZI|nr:uncharacterized protein BKA67DRAFT_537012 [Truncatella angustata]KAH6653328.1 hypothetical protein BKA67DRAFT_537012 [Truncatella angustata]
MNGPTKYVSGPKEHCLVSFGPAISTSAAPRKKIQKRGPYVYLGQNIVSYDLSTLIINRKSSFCRELPNSLHTHGISQRLGLTRKPSYQNLRDSSSACSPPKDLRSVLQHKPQTTEHQKISNFPCQVVPQDERGSLTAPGGDPYTAGAPKVTYDRALRLAESYRALLPDMRTPEPGCSGPEQSKAGNNHTQNSGPTTSPTTQRPRILVDSDDGRNARAPSIAASSVTAVESDVCEGLYGNAPVHKMNNDETHTLTVKIGMSQNDDWSTYASLQMCLDLFTDELVGALFLKRHPEEGEARSSKLQILLLIESYEAMIEISRQKMLCWPEADDLIHIREGIRILNHWLHCLYRMYDDSFSS